MFTRIHLEVTRRDPGEGPTTEYAHPPSEFAHARRCGSALWRSCLQIMGANVAPIQRILLHCFTGTVEQVVS
ncbi:hypothetical protein DPMN_148412 [Dreissena polymorpha]|uniref:Uncharacterized protein n=1 Tax=Dreissena polymorpha TaxID=45954 RepID=A0A9D4F9I7_DREPO|nr:hypothetical protein DPMN_148412 [Dreissena polymorpha]